MSVPSQPAAPASDLVDSPRAWLVVAASFIVGFVVFGILYSFGPFLEPMRAGFGTSRTAISVLFSGIGLIFYFAGPFAGHLSDRIGPRPMMLAGALVLVAGMALTGMATSTWHAYITYGIGAGVGLALAYTPSIAIVGGWFNRKRPAALGIAAAGTGFGTLVLPPLSAALIQDHGWRMASAMLGVICGLLLLVAAGLARPPPVRAAPTGRGLGDTVRSRPFLLLYASWVFATTALFIAFVFLPVHAAQLGVDPVAASALVSLIGAVSIAGRVGTGAIGTLIGTRQLFRIAVAIMAGSYVIWLAAWGYGGLVAFAVCLGLGYGLRIALMPAVLIEFFGLSNLGALLGTFFTAGGVAAIIGPLAAAAVMDMTGGFSAGIALALVLGVLGLLAVLPLPRPGQPGH